MNRYAEVVLPLGVDKVFTYLIPPELEASALPGVRVVVPFGRKIATGIIVGLTDRSDVSGVKPIRDVVDAAPVLRKEIPGLCRWIADYYFAPLGEVLKAALPQGFSPSSTRHARLSQDRPPEPSDLSPARTKILSVLASEGTLSARELGRRCGIRSVNAVLNDLEQSGYVVLEEAFKQPRKHSRVKDFIRIGRVDPAVLKEHRGKLTARSTKARSLLETLSSLKESGKTLIAVTDLARTSGAGTTVIRRYIRSGLLPVEQRDVGFIQDLGSEEQTMRIVLNDAQSDVKERIVRAMHGETGETFLLHGVTGSGKTQVYIEAIRACLALGKGAIVLVPEISLTPQIVRRFNSHFPGSVAVLHSRLSPAERFDVWKKTAASEYRVVIGPRSALFAPVHPVGLIVIDEEHEASYKQFDAQPRYQARDAALVRAKLSGAVAVLGSATPSLESYHNAVEGKYTLLTLPDRIDKVPMPAVSIVDMREERKREYAALRKKMLLSGLPKWKGFQQGSLSEELKEKITDRLGRKEGVILLQNRRGFAPFVECLDCGYAESCERCSVTLTYHLTRKHLRCHYCGAVYPTRTTCPECSSDALQLKGIGTQRVQEELRETFPEATVLRMDLDTTTRKGSHEKILQQFGRREADILLGTQMVAKGLDFPHVTLVGVISADTQMLLPDFRAAERTFQLLTQVAGRAGRSVLKGEVLVQTHQSAHYVLRHVLDHDYTAFYAEETASRAELGYPPYSRLVLIEIRGTDDREVQQAAERLGSLLTPRNGSYTLLGPSPAVLHKLHDHYRWHLLLKADRSVDPSGVGLRSVIRSVLPRLQQGKRSGLRIIIDVDPAGLL